MTIAYDCDVLIAGGDPTGVTLAILLARRGVKVIVAEKEADIYRLPRKGVSVAPFITSTIKGKELFIPRYQKESRRTQRLDEMPGGKRDEQQGGS